MDPKTTMHWTATDGAPMTEHREREARRRPVAEGDGSPRLKAERTQ
ncbi:MAG: hypothetical protein OEM05_19005 [Myxococcales bacterium]|nr:hypothetical protein [Myxococcales bacterium]